MVAFHQFIFLLVIVSLAEGKYEWEGAEEGICTDECAQRGESYYWCHKPSHIFHRTGWDYCSPLPGYAANGCKCTSECDYGHSPHRWCYTAENCDDAYYNCGPVRELKDGDAEPIYVPIYVPGPPLALPPPPLYEPESEEPYVEDVAF